MNGTPTRSAIPGAPFVFTDEQVEFRDTVRRFARETFAATYLERALADEYPSAELRQLAELGLTSLAVADEFGGQGADLFSLAIAVEEVSYADAACGYLVFATNIAAGMIARYATSAARQKWLEPIISGHVIACVALTEPEVGSDAAALKTRAVRTDGGWLLTGEKTSITQAIHSDVAIVFAQTDPTLGSKGIASFLVALDDPTVTTQKIRDPGFRCLGRGSITLDSTFVADDHVVGSVGEGFGLGMHEFDLTRTLIAMLVVGPAQRAIDMATAYATERQAFGRPIAVNQGVSFPIAEHTTYLEAVRALTYVSLGLRASGQPHTVQASMLKWWAPEVAFDAIKDAIILHGHVGWSDEMPLQAMLRDVSAYFIGDGTPQIQKMIIGRHVIGRDAVDG